MRNPTRRSRNIGTAKQGHGRDNRLCVPLMVNRKADIFVERLSDSRRETRTIGSEEITFAIEKPRSDNAHACCVDDIARVLTFVPAADLRGIAFVVLRQPKRKEEILDGAWGRYFPEYALNGRWGSAIILEACDLSRVLRWRKPLHPSALQELNVLRAEGHEITETRKHFEIRSTLEAVRQTQLFGTLPHEIGHHVHASRDPNFDRLPAREKEAFAEKYAREFGAVLQI